MSETDSTGYHLRELEIASAATSPLRVMPPLTGRERGILDVGCGAGQTLIASPIPDGAVAVGADVDAGALALGRQLTSRVRFVRAAGEALPFRGASFDLVISRVALPYMDVPAALSEMRRVLRAEGVVWLALHPPVMAGRQLIGHARRLELKGVVFQLYVLASGAMLHLTGRPLPALRGRRESCQTARGITLALRRAGFSRVAVHRDNLHMVVTATTGERGLRRGPTGPESQAARPRS